MVIPIFFKQLAISAFCQTSGDSYSHKRRKNEEKKRKEIKRQNNQILEETVKQIVAPALKQTHLPNNVNVKCDSDRF